MLGLVEPPAVQSSAAASRPPKHEGRTETVLEVEGLEPGDSFTVVLVAEDGQEFASGTFFGSEVLIECRMNAAIMRDEVERVEITGDDGGLIAQAELPEAIDPEEVGAEEVDSGDVDAGAGGPGAFFTAEP